MGLAELLALASKEGRPDQTWEQLYPMLRSVLRTLPFYAQLQESDRDELLHDVAMKLFSMGSIPVAGKGDAVCAAYVRRMFINLQAERASKTRREMPTECLPAVPEAPLAEEVTAFLATFGLLTRVYKSLLAMRREAYRAELEKDWLEVTGLLSGTRTMEQILLEREQVEQGSSAEAHASAMQRIYKRHSRMRSHLSLGARQMLDAGSLSSDEFSQLETLLGMMSRSQQKGGTT
jgi:hypothetical protein